MKNPINAIQNLTVAQKKNYVRIAVLAAIGIGVLWSCADDAHEKRERRRIAMQEYAMIKRAVLGNERRMSQASLPVPMPSRGFGRFGARPTLHFPLELEAPSASNVQRRDRRQRELESLRSQVEADEERLDRNIRDGGPVIGLQGQISRAKARIFDLENED